MNVMKKRRSYLSCQIHGLNERPGLYARVATALLLPLMLMSRAVSQECATSRASQAASGAGANGDSYWPSLSADGKRLAFYTSSSNLVGPDTNGKPDVVVLYIDSHQFEMVSVSSNGTQGDGFNGGPVISGDGRKIVFGSLSTNLDPRDTDSAMDVYQRDLDAKTTRLVSIRRGPGSTPTGVERWATNYDGRFVAFLSTDHNFPVQGSTRWGGVYFVDMLTEAFELISVNAAGVPADFYCNSPTISGDGRFVAFQTPAKNLGLENLHGRMQAWVKDRVSGFLRPVSVLPSGTFSRFGCTDNTMSMSYDGRFIAFCGFLPELTGTEPWSIYSDKFHGVAVRDMLTGTTENAYFAAGGQRPNNPCKLPRISMDGRFVSYVSHATNLVPGIKEGPDQVYRYDRQTGALRLMSTSNAGEPANSGTIALNLSGDGRTVAFESFASNLVPGDAGLSQDIFVRSCERDLVGTHCAPSVSSSGCLPHLAARGAPSLSQAHSFEVHASQVPPGVNAMLLISTSGPWLEPIRGHQYLCIKPPLLVTSPFQTTGTSRTSCSGTFSFDLNAYWAANPSQAPAPGSLVFLQAWCADPASGVGASMSDSLFFELAP